MAEGGRQDVANGVLKVFSQLQKDEFEAMKAEAERLQSIEQELERFRKLNLNPRDIETFVKNKSAIRHYLNLVPMLLE